MNESTMSGRRVPIFAIAALVAAASGGCASQEGAAEESSSTSSTSWAEEMAQEYDKATSPDVRAALKDNSISDQEYAEMKERYKKCLASAGITLNKYDFDGSVYTPPSSMNNDEATKLESRCSTESGEFPIAYFYVQMRANPTHKDMGQAIVDCFKRKNLVGPGYGLKDYQAGDFPTDESKSVAIGACERDPDGRLGG